MKNNVIKNAAEHVFKRLSKEGSGHDWHHTRRVWEMACFLQSKEGGDLELIELASLLHCAAEHDFKKGQTEKMRCITMQGILDVLNIDDGMKNDIISIAEACRYKGSDTLRPSTIESKIVQDANWLEVLGAIGVARIFTAGGYLGRIIYEPSDDLPIRGALTQEIIKKHKKESSSINYFYEKALLISDYISTETAKTIAEKRLIFTKLFMDQFMREWNKEDLVA